MEWGSLESKKLVIWAVSEQYELLYSHPVGDFHSQPSDEAPAAHCKAEEHS